MASTADALWEKCRPTGNTDYTFKLLMVGESGVGKSSMTGRYVKDDFDAHGRPSLGIDLEVTTLTRRGKQIKLQIWDTAGQEKYRAITVGFYRGGMGFMLVYDVTNEASFLKVRDWLTQIRMYAWESARVMLVGNKTDLDSDRVITKDMGRNLANQLGLDFFETTAKDNVQINEAFVRLVDSICDQMEASVEKDYEIGDELKDNIYSVKAADEIPDRCAC